MQLVKLWHKFSGGSGRLQALLGFWLATLLCSCLVAAVYHLWWTGKGAFVFWSSPYLISAVTFSIAVAIWWYRRKPRPIPQFRLLTSAIVSVTLGLAMLGMLLWVVGYGWVMIPFQLFGITIGVVLFSVIFGIYSVAVCLWHLAVGPHWRLELMRLGKGALGAVALAAVTGGLTVLTGGGWTPLSTSNLFYAIVVPALVGFAWCATVPKTPSKLFAMVSLWGAFSIAFTTFPFLFSEPFGVTCRGDKIGAQRFWGFAGAPWYWHEDPVVAVAGGPSALAVLTILNISEPTPEC